MTTTLPNIFTNTNKGNGIILSPLKMRKYLEKKGFAQFMTSEDRTAKRFYVQDFHLLRLTIPNQFLNHLKITFSK